MPAPHRPRQGRRRPMRALAGEPGMGKIGGDMAEKCYRDGMGLKELSSMPPSPPGKGGAAFRIAARCKRRPDAASGRP